jgi:transcriptional regulator with XRE-family HTH domain
MQEGKGRKMSQAGVLYGAVTPDSPLRRWRQQHGHTQAWLAAQCGVTVGTVARWEKAEQPGGRKPAGEALLCLLRVTSIPAEGLLFPERYLTENPTYLAAWASSPQRRGRPRKRQSEEGPAHA